MKTNDNYKPNRLPEKYKVPPNKKLEELKWNRNAAITVLMIVFFLFELVIMAEGAASPYEEAMGNAIWGTVLVFGPAFIFGIYWFWNEKEIKPLEEQQRRKEEDMARRI